MADARSAIGALVAATRAGDLTAERQEAAKVGVDTHVAHFTKLDSSMFK